MNYVKSFDLFGVPATQIPATPGSGAPTTATEGAVGCLYMDTDTGNLYKCTSVADGVYTWVEAGNGSGGTEADREAILNEVMQALSTPVYGRVDEENNIIITAQLADGMYTLKYENADGTKVDIGIIELGSSDVVVDESGPIVIEWAGGVKLDKNNGTEGSGSNYGASQSIAYDSTYQYTIATTNNYATQAAICWYGDSGYLGWNDVISAGTTPGSQASAILTPLDGATSFRVRAYTIHSDATNRDNVLSYISVRKDLIQ